MSKFVDLTGQKFGRLTVLSYAGKSKNGSFIWNCRCDCGNTRVAVGCEMKSGNTSSCGCLAHDVLVKRNTKHGMANTPIYAVWSAMKNRCLNPNDEHYDNYGGRGIKLSEKWLTFEGFYEDMGDSYKKGLTIERRDSNGNYYKENCVWETRLVQGNNTRRNRIETVNGVTGTLAQLCRKFDVSYCAVRHRTDRGMSIEEAFNKPFRKSPTTKRAV